MMSRGDYVAIAALIRRTLDRGGDVATLVRVTVGLADIFKADNPRFDEELFVTACLGEQNSEEGA